jgi:hypothetical protein
MREAQNADFPVGEVPVGKDVGDRELLFVIHARHTQLLCLVERKLGLVISAEADVRAK